MSSVLLVLSLCLLSVPAVMGCKGLLHAASFPVFFHVDVVTL